MKISAIEEGGVRVSTTPEKTEIVKWSIKF